MSWFLAMYQEKRTLVLASTLGVLALIAVIYWTTRSSGAPADSNPEIARLERAAKDHDIDALQKGIGNSDPNVGSFALGQLARVNPNAAREYVYNGLSDKRWQVRQQAVRSVPRVYDRSAASAAVLDAMNKLGRSDSSPEVRSAVAATATQMQKLDGEQAWNMVPPLVEQLDDPDQGVRTSAFKSLQSILVMKFDKKAYDPAPPAPNATRQKFMEWMREHLPSMKSLVVDFYNKHQLPAGTAAK